MEQDKWEREAALAEILLSSWKQRRPELARAAEGAVLRQVMWVHNSDRMVYATNLRKVLLFEGQVQDEVAPLQLVPNALEKGFALLLMHVLREQVGARG